MAPFKGFYFLQPCMCVSKNLLMFKMFIFKCMEKLEVTDVPQKSKERRKMSCYFTVVVPEFVPFFWKFWMSWYKIYSCIATTTNLHRCVDVTNYFNLFSRLRYFYTIRIESCIWKASYLRRISQIIALHFYFVLS